jgi:hypothetical protein
MTTQSGFPCVGGAPEATSIANFDDHLSRGSVIADMAGKNIRYVQTLPMSVQESSARSAKTLPSRGVSRRDLARYRRYQHGKAGLSGAPRIIVVLEASLFGGPAGPGSPMIAALGHPRPPS